MKKINQRKEKMKQIERGKICLETLMLVRMYDLAFKLRKIQGEAISIKEVNKKLGRNFSINALQISKYLKMFQRKGFLKIVSGGIVLKYGVKNDKEER